MEYYNKSIKIKEEIGDKNGISISLNSFGYIYYLQGYYTKALEKCTNALSIAKEIGRVEAIRNSSKYLWEINKKLGKNNQALEMYELYIEMRDSILRIENKEAMIQKEFKYEYEKQAIADSIAHADEILIQQAENLAKEEQLKSEKQRRTGLLVIVGLVLVSLGFVFVQLRKTRAQKVVIEGQHQKLNETHDKLNESHQEITDSINYAKRIQDALMTSTVYMKDVIPESFIFF
ncbi:MAG: hypothetical protein CL846_00965, partial [Crocinitomicaceae bacterium]|nr:hypothetical protein [Crocinitomicaceae bacterium]